MAGGKAVGGVGCIANRPGLPGGSWEFTGPFWCRLANSPATTTLERLGHCLQSSPCWGLKLLWMTPKLSSLILPVVASADDVIIRAVTLSSSWSKEASCKGVRINYIFQTWKLRLSGAQSGAQEHIHKASNWSG